MADPWGGRLVSYQRLPWESGFWRQPPLPGLVQLRVTVPALFSSIEYVPPPFAATESTETVKVSSVPVTARLAQRRLHVLQRRDVGVVALAVRVERLERGARIADGGLRARVLRLRALVQERGQCNAGEDPDDQDHHHELDQGEAAIVARTVEEASCHCLINGS